MIDGQVEMDDVDLAGLELSLPGRPGYWTASPSSTTYLSLSMLSLSKLVTQERPKRGKSVRNSQKRSHHYNIIFSAPSLTYFYL